MRRLNLFHIQIFRRLVIHEMSMFTPIGADPFNPVLMQAVPPKKMDAMHASKTGQWLVQHLYSDRRSNRPTKYCDPSMILL